MTLKLPETLISDPGLRRVFAMLEGAGHQALLVGGTVRNALLGMDVADFDIATDALPQQVVRLAESANLRAVPTGLEHGTVTLVCDGTPIEVTTFRKDIQTDGRHAVVAFSDQIEEDAKRRDFTMNALYASSDGSVVDPLSGLPDLLGRRVRFVGDPEERIREDYLRILRFFRFTAWYAAPSEGIDADGLAACAALADGLERLSAERVWAEVKKLLSAPDPAWVVGSMAQSGVLARCLPGTAASALGPLLHAEVELALAPDPLRRLVALGGEEPESGLRLSRAETRHMALLRKAVASGETPLALGHNLGEATALDVIALRFALLESLFSTQTRADIARGAQAKFPVRAGDLPSNIQGAGIGQTLERLKADWLAEDCAPDRANLLARL